MTHLRLAPLVLLAAASLAALAQIESPPGHAHPDPLPAPPSKAGGADARALGFAQLDKNGDGKLGSSEAGVDTRLAARFTELDTDKNGTLSNGEFAAWAGTGG